MNHSKIDPSSQYPTRVCSILHQYFPGLNLEVRQGTEWPTLEQDWLRRSSEHMSLFPWNLAGLDSNEGQIKANVASRYYTISPWNQYSYPEN